MSDDRDTMSHPVGYGERITMLKLGNNIVVIKKEGKDRYFIRGPSPFRPGVLPLPFAAWANAAAKNGTIMGEAAS